MALCREQIEHFDKYFGHPPAKVRKYMKNQMNRLIRRMMKRIQDDEIGYKTNRKPTRGWEY